mmetsp:Transcript_28647/g.62657  ORF Transcript_28647/g.62657 Transcript_28647/m.62657 type:complete len:343 (+) Transcript_28647:23-1051(+)
MGGRRAMMLGIEDRTRWSIAAVAFYAVYAKLRTTVRKRAERAGTRIGPLWMGKMACWMMESYSNLVGVRLASEGGVGLSLIDRETRYLLVWHPHGFIAWTPTFLVGKMAITGHPIGREWYGMIAPALFNLPVFSEALMLLNGRGVGKEVVESILGKGKATINIQPGGIKEQMITRHDQEQAVFPANLGFIRMAIKYGMPILPVYIFNENSLFKRVDGFEGLTKFVYKTTGFGMPFITGKFGLPMSGLLPRATDVHVRWGEPLQVGPVEQDPSDERVEEVFCEYLLRLRTLFYTHAYECLPSKVAERGLVIIRLDGKPVPPLSADLEAMWESKATKQTARSRL